MSPPFSWSLSNSLWVAAARIKGMSPEFSHLDRVLCGGAVLREIKSESQVAFARFQNIYTENVRNGLYYNGTVLLILPVSKRFGAE